MDVIQMARELGKMIQLDGRYLEYVSAKEKNDNDADLQQMIGEFNLKRMELNNEMSKADKSEEKLAKLDTAIRELYGTIMANENMKQFTAAKDGMDEMLSQINMIITMSANGEDPETCSAEASCSGDCCSCGGCH